MFTASPDTNTNALRLVSDELASWSQPEVDTAYRLQAEAKRPVVDVPCSPDQCSAKVITMVTRLRTQRMPIGRLATLPTLPRQLAA